MGFGVWGSSMQPGGTSSRFEGVGFGVRVKGLGFRVQGLPIPSQNEVPLGTLVTYGVAMC